MSVPVSTTSSCFFSSANQFLYFGCFDKTVLLQITQCLPDEFERNMLQIVIVFSDGGKMIG